MKKILILLFFATLFINNIYAQNNYNLTLLSHLTYPGKELSNIWGYTAPDGTEYAILGTTNTISIVSLADPTNPQEVANVPGPNTSWREIKVWGEYAYVGLDNVSVGLLIIDLTNLPNSVTYNYWTPSINLNGNATNLTSIHTVTMDEYGRLYCNGTNVGNGQPLMFDVTTSPLSPTFLGAVGTNYSHDSYARHDTLWSADIYNGWFSVYNVSNPSNPVLLATQNTPNNFTHNIWLSDDSRFAFTTDERENAYVASYDVSDLDNIVELDRYQPKETQGLGVIPHNVHVKNDFVVTSYYTDGVKILDGSNPYNLVEVASYDTYDGPDGGFFGCWGVFPYFNSGIIIASDINTGLWVFQPNYVRASFLEGIVSDASNSQHLSGVTVKLGETSSFNTTSLSNGAYNTGTPNSGVVSVTFSKAGYITKTVDVTLVSGSTITLDVSLTPVQSFNISGNVRDAQNLTKVAGAKVIYYNDVITYTSQSDNNGNYTFPNVIEGNYNVFCSAWGYKGTSMQVNITNSTLVDFSLIKGYEDDFAVDLGWTVESTCSTGFWTLGVPIATSYNGQFSNVNADVDDDLGNSCYITGNSAGAAGDDDVDNGSTILTSPSMDLTGYNSPIIEYRAWFFNSGGSGTPNDAMTVKLNNGSQTVTLETINTSASEWRPLIEFNTSSLIAVTNNMTIIFDIGDTSPGHLVEGGVDMFKVTEGNPNKNNDIYLSNINVHPNPFSNELYIDAANEVEFIETYNTLGELLDTKYVTNSGSTAIGQSLQNGFYFVKIYDHNKNFRIIPIVKQSQE
ncbi:MAG: choice-of-anchor B family protein [Saprospiraceae bacterium]|nr:choice-of-anchor B family protein [Saprospiraceae bacterium]